MGSPWQVLTRGEKKILSQMEVDDWKIREFLLDDFIFLVLVKVRQSVKAGVKFKSTGNLNWLMQIDKRRKMKTL